ncbi:MAG: phosphotransferase enzyme family protein [Candidatus Heimdallarchaeota archaeon]
MKSEIESLFTDDILDQAIEKFDLNKKETKVHNSFESFIYYSEWQGEPCILRITHSSHRTTNQIKGELDWINFLADRGAPVCRAYPSPTGEFVERVDVANKTSYFSVAVFEKAEGEFIRNNKEKLTTEFVQKWGKLIGMLHRLTKDYPEPTKEMIRPEWSAYIPRIEQFLADDSVALPKAKEIFAKILVLPKDKDSYGLIHYDVHQSNFLINNDEFALFDFDDSEYSWFIADIAVIMITIFWGGLNGEQNREEFAQWFFENIMIGYKTENTLSNWWLKKLPDFIRLRHVLLYSVLKQEMKLNPKGPWQPLLDQWQPMIENDIPYIALDFLYDCPE